MHKKVYVPRHSVTPDALAARAAIDGARALVVLAATETLPESRDLQFWLRFAQALPAEPIAAVAS